MASLKIKNHIVLFDDDDEPRILKERWSIRNGWGGTPYAYSNTGKILMHRLLICAVDGLLVDHKNHNTLDNRKDNLRICTRAQNMWNRKKTCGTSLYKGVYFHKKTQKWAACISLNNKSIHLGVYKNECDAAIAYNNAAKNLFKDFAFLNEVKL